MASYDEMVNSLNRFEATTAEIASAIQDKVIAGCRSARSMMFMVDREGGVWSVDPDRVAEGFRGQRVGSLSSLSLVEGFHISYFQDTEADGAGAPPDRDRGGDDDGA